MSHAVDQLSSLGPALAFLLAGVPLAVLLDRLGLFEEVAVVMTGRGRETSVLALWVLAALTTVVLNLDTTVVLLTPLYLRIARRLDVDPLGLVVIPLLLASLASSVLPVSNLTTLIFVDRFHVGVGPVFTHLALPSLAATVVGWFAYRRRFPTRLPMGPVAVGDPRVLTIGASLVLGLLVGFVIGPSLGVDAWMTALVADLILVVGTRSVPWRSVPVGTAAEVAVVALVVALVTPSDALREVLGHSEPFALAAIGALAVGAANAVNNLPAVLIATGGIDRVSWGAWAWLLGANVGAMLLPMGALANILWLRIVRADALPIGIRRYVRITFPIAAPAVAAALMTLGLERALV